MSSTKLEQYLSELHSETPKTRANACRKLGQLGDPQAISALSSLYQRETDPKVRQAAESALRDFAVQEGGRKGGRLLRNLNVLLGLVFVVLIGLNAMTRLGGSESAVPTPLPRETLLAIYEAPQLPALTNVELLRAEYQAPGGILPCNAPLETIAPVPTITPLDAYVYPDLANSSDLVAALDLLNFVTQSWQTACASEEKLNNEAATYVDALNQIEGFLTAANTTISQARANPLPTVAPPPDGIVPPSPTASPTSGPSPTPTLTPTATNTPLPTVDPSILNRLAAITSGSIQELESLKTNRWIPVRDGGVSPFGCAGATFELEDFTQAPPDLLQAEPELGAAITLVNEALGLARQSNQAYIDNCQNQSFSVPIIEGGIAQADQAIERLLLAQATIQDYQGR